MTQPKFTPGPWHVEGGSVWAEAKDGSNLRIAQPWAVLDYVSVGERNANAALIAAAPDMYAALKRVVENKWEPDKYHMAVTEALRKAEGGAQ